MRSAACVTVALALLPVLLPEAVGHNDTGSRLGAMTNGVSGIYVSDPQNVLIGSDLFPIGLPGGVTLFPMGYAATYTMKCDLEVLSDGNHATSEDNAVDEVQVDDETDTGGMVGDGTWDDGGYGGACHVGHHTTASYNSAGCLGTSYAEDAIMGGAIWIGAACDYMTQVREPLDCVNEGLLDTPDPVSAAFACVTTCLDESLCPGETLGCGADGTPDALNVGTGATGVPYPMVGFECEQADGLAATFAFTSTIVQSGATILSQATTGWIDCDECDNEVTFAPAPSEDEVLAVAPCPPTLTDSGEPAAGPAVALNGPVPGCPIECSWDTTDNPRIEQLAGPIWPYGEAGYISPAGNSLFVEYYVCATKLPDKNNNKYVMYVFTVSAEAGSDFDIPDGGPSAQRLRVVRGNGAIVDREVGPNEPAFGSTSSTRGYSLGGKVALDPGRGPAGLGGEVGADASFSVTAANLVVTSGLVNARDASWKVVATSSYPSSSVTMSYGVVQRVPAGGVAILDWSVRAQFEPESWLGGWETVVSGGSPRIKVQVPA